jgi:hypothetical protein
MATLEPNRTLSTRTSAIEVDGTFKAGRHRFQLVVVRADGKVSLPDIVTVEVVDSGLRRPV